MSSSQNGNEILRWKLNAVLKVILVVGESGQPLEDFLVFWDLRVEEE